MVGANLGVGCAKARGEDARSRTAVARHSPSKTGVKRPYGARGRESQAPTSVRKIARTNTSRAAWPWRAILHTPRHPGTAAVRR